MAQKLGCHDAEHVTLVAEFAKDGHGCASSRILEINGVNYIYRNKDGVEDDEHPFANTCPEL